MAQSEDSSVRTVDPSFPSLPKIKTKPVKDGDLLEREKEEEEKSSDEVTGCETPTSEEHRIKPPTECPPAPQKPPAPKRKMGEKIPNMRQLVPRNLSVVFAALPPKKRLRAGSHVI